MKFFYLRYWRESLNDWLFIFNREVRQIFHDGGALLFFIFLPLGYPILYSLIYTTESVHNVPIVVIDEDRSATSREYLRKVDATPDVRIVMDCPNMEEAKEMLRRREAYGIVYIPSSFDHDLAEHKAAHVAVYSDMSSLLYYKSVLTANTNVSLDMNADIKVRLSGNYTNKQDETARQAIAYESVNQYNPQAGMASFILPAVLILILQQSFLLGIGLLAGTAREGNKQHDLVPVERHHHGLLRIVFAKSSVYLLIYFVQSVYCLGVVPRIFELPQIGNPFTMFFFLTPFMISVVFFGMTLSTLIRERENVILVIVFTSLILLFISGISWPGAAVPKFWKAISYLFPSTFGVNGFVRINTMGADLLAVRREWDALWILTAFYFFTACICYRFKIIRARIKTYKAYREERSRRSQGILTASEE